MSIGSVIKDSRIRKNLKQSAVAADVGVTVQTYIKWENDETEPKASQIAKLSGILGVSSNSICTGMEDKKYELTRFMRLFSKLNDKASDFEVGISIWEMLESDEGFIERLRKNAGIPEFTYDHIEFNEHGEPIYLVDDGMGYMTEVKDPLWD
jgi:transcriptional regulator with XRE-family HTH domain